MTPRLSILLLLVLAALAGGGLTACGDDGSDEPKGSGPAGLPTDDSLLLAAGDIAQCDSKGDEATARVAARFPAARIAALGDLAYPASRPKDIERCYDPSWGKLGNRVWPAAGNHEYLSGDATSFFRHFGKRAGPSGKGWHSYELGDWHIVVLNSNCESAPGGGCARGSEQERWLRDDLDRSKRLCTLAYMHHPPRSSGFHGDNPSVEPLRRALTDAHADVLLAAHDHHYERFAPRDGIREWVVGTGGAHHYGVRKPQLGSEVSHTGTPGLLALSLRDKGYDWRFLAATRTDFKDSGDGRCS